jgi:hypothetical protein
MHYIRRVRMGWRNLSKTWKKVPPAHAQWVFHPFEPPIEACTSFYVEILAQKVTWFGRLLDLGW